MPAEIERCETCDCKRPHSSTPVKTDKGYVREFTCHTCGTKYRVEISHKEGDAWIG